jgi:DNA-binding GntR family transcriptional regulator
VATSGNGYEPLAQRVARELRERIYDGRYGPGTPVRQEAIAAELGVSRIPVREALRLLENEGLVVIRPHSGARVALLDFEECLQIYKIRERLEPLAFSESVGRLSDEQLKEVVDLAKHLESLTHDQRVWLEGDRRLHLAMYAGMQSRYLLGMIVGFWNTTQQYRRVLLSTFTENDFEIAHDEHRLMVDALIRENARAGEDVLRIGMERSRLRLASRRDLFDR